MTDEKRTYEVAPADEGKRLDRWLHERCSEQFSRSQLKRFIEDGRVHVADATAKPSTPLRTGQRVDFDVPPPMPSFPIAQDIPLDLLHEDAAILVIDKPADRVVHSSPGVAEGGSIVNALLAHTDELSPEGGENRPGIVHRLDRETSGVMVIARTDAAHRELARQFKEREVEKEYWAWVHGVPSTNEGTVDHPLGRSPTQSKKQTIRHDEGGKPAFSAWKLAESNGVCSRIVVHPRSGRTHQIRVHLKSIGLPILCDALYGQEKKITKSEIRGRKPRSGETPILERHALHARSLRFTHPDTGERVTFEAPLPEDLERVLRAISSME